ncbi:MAG: tetratricopeptide repeat protein [Chloroflexota bacterium]|nr:tetratricopeptide repeat protein [Chloroflexota bacterium]
MAGGKGDSPHISEFSVRKMLESMLYAPGAKKHDTSPLEHLAVIDAIVQDPATPAMERGRLFALEQFLVELITDQYLSRRAAEGLPPLDKNLSRAGAMADLNQVKLTGRNELESWAMLYYRFVQIDLSLKLEEIRTALALEESTFRRHFRHAIKRICGVIRAREQEARRQHKQRHMLARLPGEPETRIVGRVSLISDTLDRIKEMPHIMMVSGPVGVGKRCLVRAVVARLIEEDLIDQLLWIDQPRSAEQVRLRLLELAAPHKQSAERIDIRTYLLNYRTVIVLAGVSHLAQAPDSWNALLLDLDAATVFVIDNKYTPIDALTAHVVVPPLDQRATIDLARVWWSRFHRGDVLTEEELLALARQSGGSPGVLRRMIAAYGHALPETMLEASVGRAYGDTLALLSPGALETLYRVMLVPPTGHDSVMVANGLNWNMREGMDELLRHYLLERAQVPGSYQLVPYMRDWIEQDYRRGGQAKRMLDAVIESLDAVVVNDTASALPIVEYVLMADWLILAPERRQMWLREAWHCGVRVNHWALWLEVLRRETGHEQHGDPALWIGRGVCARWLALWSESAEAFEQAIALAGDAGDFITQAEAVLELSILRRLQGHYEEAQQHQLRVGEVAERFSVLPLLERLWVEQAQIALECGNSKLTLQHLHDVPVTEKILLMRAEAFLLLGEPEGCLAELLHLLPDDDAEIAATGKAHALAGRALYEMGDHRGSRSEFEKAIVILEKAHDPYGLGRAYANLGGVLIETRRDSEAIPLLERAELLHQQLGDRVALFATQHNLRVLRGRIGVSR